MDINITKIIPYFNRKQKKQNTQISKKSFLNSFMKKENHYKRRRSRQDIVLHESTRVKT
jgi:hypothetical protein